MNTHFFFAGTGPAAPPASHPQPASHPGRRGPICFPWPLLLLLPFALPLAAPAQDFTYTTNNGAITITGYTGPGGHLTIPDTIDGLPVTVIGPAAFAHCASVTSITIPNGVRTIRDSAFYACLSLTNVALPNSVTNIGASAFLQCPSLTSITLPDRVTAIEGWAFGSCSSLTHVALPDSLTSLGPGAFSSCTSLASITLPDGLNMIGSDAFSHCTSLTSITIPNGVRTIRAHVFYECSSLTHVTVGHSVTNIEDSTFRLCSNLACLYFRGHAPGLGPDAFLGHNNLIIYRLPGTLGWGSTLGGRPTASWYLPRPTILDFPPFLNIHTNHFTFRMSWATNASVVIEASTHLATDAWFPLTTNTLIMGVDPLTDGWSDFADPDDINHPARFYRLRSP